MEISGSGKASYYLSCSLVRVMFPVAWKFAGIIGIVILIVN